MQHSPVGNQQIYNEASASMHAYMRKSTIRQEIHDILFVRSGCLLLDESFVSIENRHFLIDKIRNTILKSCEAEQSNNTYQY